METTSNVVAIVSLEDTRVSLGKMICVEANEEVITPSEDEVRITSETLDSTIVVEVTWLSTGVIIIVCEVAIVSAMDDVSASLELMAPVG